MRHFLSKIRVHRWIRRDPVGVAWLFEGTRIPVDGMFMTDNPLKLYTPEGWEYENSMTTKHILVVEDEALLSQYPVDDASLSEE